MILPTFEEVSARLSYDPETGAFTRKAFLRGDGRHQVRARPVKRRSVAVGYLSISVLGHPYIAHRVAFLLMTGEWPTAEVDHINLIRADNRWANLRLATKSQNGANRGPASTSKSGVKGIYLCRNTGRWRARIKVNKKTIHLGRYSSQEAASAAYASAAAEHFGEFARTLNP